MKIIFYYKTYLCLDFFRKECNERHRASTLGLYIVVCCGALVERAVDYYVAVGHSADLRHFVAYEKYGGVLGKLCYNLVEVRLEVLVEITKRLVENENRRTADDSAAEEYALKLTSRELAYGAGGEVFEADEGESFVDAHLFFILAQGVVAEQARRYHLAYCDREVGVDAVLLRQVAEFRSSRGRSTFGIVEDYSAAVWLQQPENQAEEGSLATTVRAGDSHEVSAVYREVDMVENNPFFSAERKVAKLDEGFFILRVHRRFLSVAMPSRHQAGL